MTISTTDIEEEYPLSAVFKKWFDRGFLFYYDSRKTKEAL